MGCVGAVGPIVGVVAGRVGVPCGVGGSVGTFVGCGGTPCGCGCGHGMGGVTSCGVGVGCRVCGKKLNSQNKSASVGVMID